MCFSAGASFASSGVLSVIGIAAIKKVKSPNQLLFAGIPFIFAIQQFSEGFVWLSLQDPAFASFEKVSTYTFLFFAQIVWPMCIPISIVLIEKDVRRKNILKIFAGIGILVASYFSHRLLMYGAQAISAGHHIAYRQVYPDSLNHFADMLYGVATLTPTFLSRIKRMWIFGLTVSLSYGITVICFVNYILSVWCFFSAVLSILIYTIVQRMALQTKR